MSIDITISSKNEEDFNKYLDKFCSALKEHFSNHVVVDFCLKFDLFSLTIAGSNDPFDPQKRYHISIGIYERVEDSSYSWQAIDVMNHPLFKDQIWSEKFNMEQWIISYHIAHILLQKGNGPEILSFISEVANYVFRVNYLMAFS